MPDGIYDFAASICLYIAEEFGNFRGTALDGEFGSVFKTIQCTVLGGILYPFRWYVIFIKISCG